MILPSDMEHRRAPPRLAQTPNNKMRSVRHHLLGSAFLQVSLMGRRIMTESENLSEFELYLEEIRRRARRSLSVETGDGRRAEPVSRTSKPSPVATQKDAGPSCRRPVLGRFSG